jgi:hypothetical protein
VVTCVAAASAEDREHVAKAFGVAPQERDGDAATVAAVVDAVHQALVAPAVRDDTNAASQERVVAAVRRCERDEDVATTACKRAKRDAEDAALLVRTADRAVVAARDAVEDRARETARAATAPDRLRSLAAAALAADRLRSARELVARAADDRACAARAADVATETLRTTAARTAAVRRVTDVAEVQVRLERGTAAEAAVLDTLQTERATPVVDRNAQMHTAYVDCPQAGTRVKLCGRVDGRFDGEGGPLIEVKVRRNRLFRTLYAYERVQVHAYMVMTGAREAILRETFDGTTNDIPVPYDAAFWDDCCTRLDDFLVRLFDRHRPRDQVVPAT